VKYSQFELLVLVLGGGAIVGSMALVTGGDPQPAEVVAQLLVVFVLGAALHWGRNGGFAAALVATLVYVFMRLPLLLSEGLTRDMLVLVAARVVTYGVVGIVGGELAGRTKYVFARFDANPLTDETTGVYNGRYAGAAIRSGVARWDRYQMPYSVVRLSLSPALATDLRPQRARHMVRQVASHIRNDIRLVDDLAHLGDGRFLVLFPNTGAAGAAVAGDRLHRGIVAMLDIEDAALEVSVCSTETDPVTLRKLAADLDPSPAAAGAPAGAGNGNAPGPEPQA